MAQGPSIEIGIIGREGMTGLPLLLGHDRAQHETFMQLAGTGLRISAAHLRRADEAGHLASCDAPLR